MAKGFTVKSAAAKAKKQAETPEWDYDKARQMKNYHIYLNDKCLFKILNQEEFDVIWGKIYYSYFKEELTYVECIDDACIQGKVEEHSY